MANPDGTWNVRTPDPVLRTKLDRELKGIVDSVEKRQYWNAISCCQSALGTLIILFDRELKR